VSDKLALRRHQSGPLTSLAIYAKLAVQTARLGKALFGIYPRECNICGHQGRFLAFGEPPRLDARCPRCGSLERHRLQAIWVNDHAEELRQARVLHFAPEAVIMRLLKPLAAQYIAADQDPRRADLVLNVEHIDLEDGAVDAVVCNHVLEHVDDARALAEFYRVLSPGGLALLSFPIIEGWDATYEDGTVAGEQARELHFGQYDHVRYYGRDVRARIAQAGFCLEEITAVEPLVARYGLLRGEKIFIGRKPGQRVP
jgi:SAM-dependent methyltransferase